MKATVQTAALKEAVEIASKAIPSRTATVEYGMILLSAKDSYLTITGNTDVFIQCTIDADIEEEGDTLIMPNSLSEILSYSGEESTVFETKKSKLQVKYRGTFELSTGDLEYFRDEPETPEDLISIPLSATDISNMSRIAEVSNVLPQAHSIHVNIGKDMVDFLTVSGNKSWISFIQKPIVGTDSRKNILVPIEPLKGIVRFIYSDLDVSLCDTKTVLSFNSEHGVHAICFFQTAGMQTFDIGKMLNTLPVVTRGTVDEALMREAVKKIKFFAVVAHLSATERELTLSGQGQDLAKITIPAIIEKPFEIGVNAEMLYSAVQGADNYEIALSTTQQLYSCVRISFGNTKYYLMQIG